MMTLSRIERKTAIALRMWTALAGAAALVGCGVETDDTVDVGAAKQGLATYQGATPDVWHNRVVEFCWLQTTSDLVDAKRLIRSSLQRSYSDVAGIAFEFSDCPDGVPPEKVGFNLILSPNMGPRDMPGGLAYGYQPGTTIEITFGPTYFLLDEVVIHEVGHLLGFAHEDQRLDRIGCPQSEQPLGPAAKCRTDADCKSLGDYYCDEYKPSGNAARPYFCVPGDHHVDPNLEYLTVYDSTSIMGACRDYDGDGIVDTQADASVWYLYPELSLVDTSGLQKYYGAKDDTSYLWWATGYVSSAPFRTRADLLPFRPISKARVGDFDGDQHDDVFVFTPGTDVDYVAWGTGNESAPWTITYPITGENDYREILVGRFNDDQYDDIFLYYPGSTYDWIYYGGANRTFTSQRKQVSGTYTPVAGDFDNNGCTDILWYSPSLSTHSLWWNDDGCAQFTSATVSIAPSLDSLASGDFNGDGFDDVVGADHGGSNSGVWYGSANRTFSKTAFALSADYQVAAGNFDGDQVDDFLLSSTTNDWTVFGAPGGPVFHQIHTPFEGPATQTVTGDFNNDGMDDILRLNSPSNNVEVKLNMYTDSATEYCLQAWVRNVGVRPITSWHFTVNVNDAQITRSWGMNRTQTTGTVSMKSLDYNSAINVGQRVSVSYCANKTGNEWYPKVTSASAATS